MGSSKWSYKSPKMAYSYSYHSDNPTYNYLNLNPEPLIDSLWSP